MGNRFYDIVFEELPNTGNIGDSVAAPSVQRPNEFTPTNPSVVNVVNVAIAPAAPTTSSLNTTIQYAQAVADASVADFGVQSTPVVVTLLETLDDAGDLASYLIRPVPAFWFGNIQVIMNGLTDVQRTTIGSLDIGSQVSVTKSFPNSTPSTVTQIMALEGISHDITPDRHIVTLYPNPTRIYTYFIVGGYTTTTTRTNLVTNPNFETNANLWGGGGTASTALARTTAQVYSGTASLQCTATLAGNIRAYFSGTTGSAVGTGATRIPVTAGQTYTFSAYTKAATTGRLVDILVEYYNSSDVLISTPETTEATNSTSAWTRTLTLTSTAPVGAVTCVPSIRILGAAISEVHYIDGVLFEQSSTLLPYFDGTYADTYTGYTLTSQGWSGTANASTSTATWGLTSSFVGSELDDETKGLA
jgi:hypothetical protein